MRRWLSPACQRRMNLSDLHRQNLPVGHRCSLRWGCRRWWPYRQPEWSDPLEGWLNDPGEVAHRPWRSCRLLVYRSWRFTRTRRVVAVRFSNTVAARMRTRVGRSALCLLLGGPPLPPEPHGPPSRCLPCCSCTSLAVVRPRVALPARFDACRGERCSLPRVRVIRACVPDEPSVPVSLLPGVGGTGETHC